MSDQCTCYGDVRFGYGTVFTPWQPVTGNIRCDASTFGDPTPGQGKVCECQPTIDMLNMYSPSYSGLDGVTSCIIVVIITYFIAFSAYNLIGSYYPGNLLPVLESLAATVRYAPMLSVLFFAAIKRAETLSEGNPSAYNLPPEWLKVAIIICTAAFCAQAALYAFCEIAGRSNSRSWAAQMLSDWFQVATALMYISILFVIFGVVFMHNLTPAYPQVILVIMTPSLTSAELQSSGPRVEFVTMNQDVFMMISIVRWILMAAMYIGIVIVFLAIWKISAVPQMTLFLVRLSVVFFSVYATLWMAVSLQQVCQGGFSNVINLASAAKDVVVFCPTLAVLHLASWVRAHRFKNALGEAGEPQGYVQDYMYVSMIAVIAMLLLIACKYITRPSTCDSASVMPQGKDQDVLLMLLFIPLFTTYLAVAVVIWGLFTITSATASGENAWIA